MDTLTENLHVAAIASTKDSSMDEPADDAPEHELCRWWREQVMELTRDQLSVLTGFSVSSIKDFEAGRKEIDPMARKRFRMACTAVSLGADFNWRKTRLELNIPTTILIGER